MTRLGRGIVEKQRTGTWRGRDIHRQCGGGQKVYPISKAHSQVEGEKARGREGEELARFHLVPKSLD